jgi:hypothetical protein
MQANFSIHEHYAITYNGRHIDLHNNFHFTGYSYTVAERKLELYWIKGSGNWIAEDELPKLKITHTNVFFLNIGYNNLSYDYPDDDKCLGEITFFPASERTVNNAIINQWEPNEGDDIIYIFETEHFIRIGCDKADLILG